MDAISLYTWIGFILFMVVMFAVGYVSARKMKNIADFATGGGAIGPRVLGLSFAATYLSEALFLGFLGCFYDGGLITFCFFLAMFFGGPTGLLLLVKK